MKIFNNSNIVTIGDVTLVKFRGGEVDVKLETGVVYSIKPKQNGWYEVTCNFNPGKEQKVAVGIIDSLLLNLVNSGNSESLEQEFDKLMGK